MTHKKFVLVFAGIIFFVSFGRAEEENLAPGSDQQISDFSLAGFGEKGKKTWELSGKSADIFTDIIKLKDIVGNMYGDKETIKLTADQGDFNKAEGKVHLEDNVLITTSSGAKLTTDSLDWDRKKQLVTTKDVVNIVRDNMVTVASGAIGQPNLNKVTLEKNVTTTIDTTAPEKPKDPKNEIVITCDGPLAVDYEKNIATFNNNVKVDKGDAQIYSDVMDVYFSGSDKAAGAEASKGPAPGGMASKIKKIVSRGNVKIVNGENVSYSEEAIYTAEDKKITLTGRPKLVIQSTEGLSASFGN